MLEAFDLIKIPSHLRTKDQRRASAEKIGNLADRLRVLHNI